MNPKILIIAISRATFIATLLLSCPFNLSAESIDEKIDIAVDAIRQGDFKAGFDLIKPIAGQGNAHAQRIVGLIYYRGWHVTKDMGEATNWLSKSANQGDIVAQYFMGIILMNYFLDGYDKSEALEWFKKSAKQGHDGSQEKLGTIYLKGKIVPEDYAEALKWYLKAAEQGNKKAQTSLGEMYRDGIGVDKDFIRAHMWLNLSGSYWKRENLEKWMETQDVIEAQRLARNWVKAHPPKKIERKKKKKSLDKSKIKQSPPKAKEPLKKLESVKKQNPQINIDSSKLSPLGDLKKSNRAALSKYAGEVYLKIFKNWKDPLGGGSGRVKISFTIFPKGIISMPKILKSSGDPKLDNLAIRAIKNAVPLPPFPKEIKEPNLPFIFNFDYVPSKG